MKTIVSYNNTALLLLIKLPALRNSIKLYIDFYILGYHDPLLEEFEFLN